MSRLANIDILRCYLSFIPSSIHSAVPYMVTVAPLWPFDDEGLWGFDGYIFETHLFSMELFFVLGGFMLAMQLSKKTVKDVIIDRLRRIVVPFVLGLILLVPVVLGVFFLPDHTESPWTFTLLKQAYFHGWKRGLAQFFPTAHLWFLYYMILFIIVTLIAWTVKKRFLKFNITLTPRLFLIGGIGLSIFSMYFMNRWIVDNPIDFYPDWTVFVHHYVYFLFGMGIYSFDSWKLYLKKNAKTLLICGIAVGILGLVPQLFFLKTNLPCYQWIRFAGIATTSTASILLSGGIWGLFSRVDREAKPFERYFSGSSYWLYLFNMPMVMIIQLLLLSTTLPVLLKFLITFVGSTLLTTVVYEFAVRRTRFGSLLKMRRETDGKRFWF